MPSKDEIAQLYIQKATVGGFVGNFYWSSSEYDANHAWLISSSDGIIYPLISKADTYYVRPVRAFGTPLTTEYLNDGFEGTFPGVWVNATISGTVIWSVATTSQGYPTSTPPHNGSYKARFESYSNGSGASARIYRSSGFAVPDSVASVTLTFFMYHDTGYSTPPYDRLQVQVTTDGGAINWVDVGPVIDRYSVVTGWTQHTLDLTAYKGNTVRLGFLGMSEYGNNIFLDDVVVTGIN